MAQIASEPAKYACLGGTEREEREHAVFHLQIPAPCENQARLGVSGESHLPPQHQGFPRGATMHRGWFLVCCTHCSFPCLAILAEGPADCVFSPQKMACPAVVWSSQACVCVSVCMLEGLEKAGQRGAAFLPLHRF